MARTTWHATSAGIIPDEIQDRILDAWYDVDRIARQAAEGQVTFLVAVDPGGAVIGYARAGHRNESGDAELYAIYVLPDHQGKGVGARLLRAQGFSPGARIYGGSPRLRIADGGDEPR